MRISVHLEEDLLAEAKRIAAEEGMTLSALVAQALREMLARQSEPADLMRLPLPTFEGRGLHPGVDLNDTAALLDLLDRSDTQA